MKIANMAYHCGLIVEAVHDRDNDVCRQIGVANVAHVERQLGEMLRDIQSSPDWLVASDLQHRLHFHFDPIRHALAVVGSYLENQPITTEDTLTARIFALHLYTEVPKLVRDFGYEEIVAY